MGGASILRLDTTHNLKNTVKRLPPWLTDKSFSDRLPRPALKVRDDRTQSSVGFAFPKGRGLQGSCNPFQRI